MKGVTFLIEKLVTTTYKKLGINGILLLLIFIAIPAIESSVITGLMMISCAVLIMRTPPQSSLPLPLQQ